MYNIQVNMADPNQTPHWNTLDDNLGTFASYDQAMAALEWLCEEYGAEFRIVGDMDNDCHQA
jgi:hypothetical protein